jgi:hypothetical protein
LRNHGHKQAYYFLSVGSEGGAKVGGLALSTTMGGASFSGFLNDPTELARFVRGRTPNLGEQLLIVGIRLAAKNKVGPIRWPTVSGIKAQCFHNDHIGPDCDDKLQGKLQGS